MPDLAQVLDVLSFWNVATAAFIATLSVLFIRRPT
jgi:hypothetical protein